MKQLLLGIVSLFCVACFDFNPLTAIQSGEIEYEDLVTRYPIASKILVRPDTIITLGDTLAVYGWIRDQFGISFKSAPTAVSYPAQLGSLYRDYDMDSSAIEVPSTWAIFFVADSGRVGVDSLFISSQVAEDTTVFRHIVPVYINP